MKRKLILAVVSCLIGAGVVTASVRSDSFKDRFLTKGYVTIGGNLVVIPERLQSGDRIEFFGLTGRSVMQHVVGQGYLLLNFSKIPSGVYDMVIYRGREIIAEEMVPIAGKTGR